MVDVVVSVDPDPVQLVQRLDEFAEELQDKALKSGLTASAKPIKDRMKKLAPVEGGALRKSIGQAQLSKRAKAIVGVPLDQRGIIVGPVRKVVDPTYKRAPNKRIAQGYKAYWLEFTGAERHKIPRSRTRRGSRKRKILKFPDGGFATEVWHRGFRTKKFIRPSLDSAGSLVGESFYRGMAKRLDRLRNA